MTAIQNFLFAFIFSFVGSIPPGTINLTIIDLGLHHKIKIALRFALAASLIEYPYAWVAVKFERLITSSPVITENLHLIAALVMTLVGLVNLWSSGEKKSALTERFHRSGFRKGLLLGILNPLAIPYWVALTAYLRSNHWIDTSSPIPLHAYLFGVFLGAFTLLAILAYLSKKAITGFHQFPWIRKVPGILLVILGLYSFIQYLILPD